MASIRKRGINMKTFKRVLLIVLAVTLTAAVVLGIWGLVIPAAKVNKLEGLSMADSATAEYVKYLPDADTIYSYARFSHAAVAICYIQHLGIFDICQLYSTCRASQMEDQYRLRAYAAIGNGTVYAHSNSIMKRIPCRRQGILFVAESEGFDLPCAAGHLGLQSAPGALLRALGFESQRLSLYAKAPTYGGSFCIWNTRPILRTD